MAQVWVACPGCPGGAPGISGANQQDLIGKLEAHIAQKHPAYAGVSALPARGQNTGSTFWAPWYVGTNCHS